MSKPKLTYQNTLNYLKNLFSNKEQHAFEKEIQKDTFEQEALDGFGLLSPENLEQDMQQLQSQLQKKIVKKKRKLVFLNYRYAASIVVLIGLTAFFYSYFQNKTPLNKIDNTIVTSPVFEEDENLEFDPSKLKKFESFQDEKETIVLEEKTSKENFDLQKSKIENLVVEIDDLSSDDISNSDGIIDENDAAGSVKLENEISSYGNVQEKKIIKKEKVEQVKLSKQKNKITKELESYFTTGIILDKDGDPLPGVSILKKGTNDGVVSDFDGNYEIRASKQDTLVFNYVGFTNLEKPVKDNMFVTLEYDPNVLNEVVVVGYGTVRKKEVVGASPMVKGSELPRSTSINLNKALQGQLAGVNIAPGTSSNIVIRGVSSTDSKNPPLYVVDGFPQESDPKISVGEVKEINVLKDTTSLAIYGTRGSNGVILITTKNKKISRAYFDKTTENSSTLENFKNWVSNHIDKSVFKANKHYNLKTKITIDKKGQVVDFKIITFVRRKIRKELENVILSSPKWKPAVSNEEKNVEDTVKITFDFFFENKNE